MESLHSFSRFVWDGQASKLSIFKVDIVPAVTIYPRQNQHVEPKQDSRNAGVDADGGALSPVVIERWRLEEPRTVRVAPAGDAPLQTGAGRRGGKGVHTAQTVAALHGQVSTRLVTVPLTTMLG